MPAGGARTTRSAGVTCGLAGVDMAEGHCLVLASRDCPAATAAEHAAWWTGLAGAGARGTPSGLTFLLVDGDPESIARLGDTGHPVVRLDDVAACATFPESGSTARSYLTYQWLARQAFVSIGFPVLGGLAHHSVCAKRQGLAFEHTLLRVHVPAPPQGQPAVDLAGGGVGWLATEFMQGASLTGCDAVVAHTREALAWVERQGLASTRPVVFGPDATAHELLAARAVAGRPGPARRDAPPPLVSVCLVHHDRPSLLAQAVASLTQQDYPNFEVVLVDDGSSQPAALRYLDDLEAPFAVRGWQIFRQDNRYVGAARNQAARLARGDYLLFMDDDNVARADELSALVRAAEHASADIVTCTPGVFEGNDPAPAVCPRVWVPYGSSVAMGLLVNAFGDANALVRRSCFEALGGFTEDYGVGHEDWELFARAALGGFRIEVVPEPLFCYRANASGMLRSGQRALNLARSIRPYLEKYPELAPVLLLLQALFEQARIAPAVTAGETTALRARLEEAERATQSLRQSFDAIAASRTWRATAPLRRLVTALRQLGWGKGTPPG